MQFCQCGYGRSYRQLRGDGQGHRGARSIERLDGLDRRLEVAGMTYHIRIGKIAYDHVILLTVDGLHQLVCDRISAHLGLEIIGHNMRRRYQDPVFPLEHPFFSAVEEKGHMGVFLRLRDPQLLETPLCDPFSKYMAQVLRREHDRYVKVSTVAGETDKGIELRHPA